MQFTGKFSLLTLILSSTLMMVVTICKYRLKRLSGAVLRWGWGDVPPDLLDLLVALPQIQKLADRCDMISEVPKCSKIQIFRGSTPDPAVGAYSAPQTPS